MFKDVVRVNIKVWKLRRITEQVRWSIDLFGAGSISNPYRAKPSYKMSNSKNNSIVTYKGTPPVLD